MRHNPAELLLLNPGSRKPSTVQSVIIPKDRFTKRQARAWIAQHGFVDPGIDETDDYYRFRQMDPDRQHFKYRTIPLGHSGVQAVVRVSRLPRRNPGTMTVDAALEVLADINADEASINEALEVLAGGSEVAQALDGSGLAPTGLAQATQIAEVQTSRGVVDVPVVDARRFPQTARFLEEEATSALPSGFASKFSFFPEVDDYTPPLLTETRRVLRDVKRGDVVTVGKTRWVIMRPVGDVQAYAYKHPSKRTKLYEIQLADTDDDVVVFEIGGSAQRISDDLVRGPLRMARETVALG